MSTRGKLRMLAEPFQPARRDDGDESLGDFVRRRLGAEALDKFIGPVLGGIYNTDPAIQSIQVSSPVMREMEKESGSLFLAALQRGVRARNNSSSGSKKPRFITYKAGIQGLVDELVKQLEGDLRLSSRVRFLDRHGDGYRVWLSNGEILYSDAIVLATLANVSAELLRDLSPEASRQLGSIRHNHIGTISIVYRESDLPGLEINGLMIPRREKRAIDAVTFTSKKMPQRSSPGYALLRVFIGGGKPEIVEYDDESLMMLVRGELSSLLGIRAEPQAYRIFRWPDGFPQAEVGHLDRVSEIEKWVPETIALAGSSYRGIAVPDCIRQGRAAVQRLSKYHIHRVFENPLVEFSATR
jgi:oxygen-dependent protoporphyrinogen oxidase